MPAGMRRAVRFEREKDEEASSSASAKAWYIAAFAPSEAAPRTTSHLMTMANFDIGSAAAQVLRRVPSATGGRPDIVKQTLLCLGGFFVADALAYLILHVVLPSRIDRFKSVNIRQAIISILHCTASIPMVFMLFGNVTNADAGPGGLLGYGPLTYIPMANIDLAASLFLGFLLWDLLHNLAYRDVYSKSIVESMIHHTGFITAMYLNKDTLWCASIAAPAAVAFLLPASHQPPSLTLLLWP